MNFNLHSFEWDSELHEEVPFPEFKPEVFNTETLSFPVGEFCLDFRALIATPIATDEEIAEAVAQVRRELGRD